MTVSPATDDGDFMTSARDGSSLRVVPLFEEVATLEKAGDTVRAILSPSLKIRATADRGRTDLDRGDADRTVVGRTFGSGDRDSVEVMIGYSDSDRVAWCTPHQIVSIEKLAGVEPRKNGRHQ